ncbi:MAG: glycosyltransferase family 4 protein [Chryseolinea sp.]
MKNGICFVGPMLYGLPNQVKTQGEILADLLEAEGFQVYRKSTIRNRVFRFLDTLFFLIFQSRRYSVMIIQIYGGLSFIMEDVASLLGKIFGKRIIMTIHGGEFPDFMVGREKWVDRVLNRADVITAPSPFLISKLERYGFHLVEIPNIINLSDLKFQNRNPFFCKILWMRAFHSLYNPTLAVKVAKELRAQNIPFSLTMAGPDLGLKKEVEDLIVKEGLEESVRVLGMLGEKEKKEEASKNSIYINTNIIDNTPVSMLEMAAMGLALVSTNVGGIPYLFKDRIHCLLSDSDDAMAMTKNIIFVLENTEEATRMVSNSSTLIKKFDWEQVKPLWLKLLNNGKN